VSVTGSATVATDPGRTLRIAASDEIDGTPGSGIKRVEIKVDAQVVKTFARVCPCGQLWDSDDATTPLVYDIDTAAYSEGEHTVEVIAYDAAGNASEVVDGASRFIVYVTQLNAIDRSKLGLEDFFHYESTTTGAGSRLHVNAASGNAVWHSTPVVNPGRGLSSVVNLTYNAHDRGGFLSQAINRGGSPVIGATLQDLIGLAYGEAGHGFSLGISGVTRLNEPLGGALTANATGVITLTDPDGTAHKFTGGLDGVFDEPKGVHLQLRRYANLTDVTSEKYWAATRPDGVTFFFDFTGYATSVEDRNGNVIRFDYETYSKIDGTPCPAVDPLPEAVCAKRAIRVVDPAGLDAGSNTGTRDARSIHITYRPGGVLRLPEDIDPEDIPDELARIGGDAGRIAAIRDHAGRLTEFTYDDDGYLTRLTQGKVSGASTNPDVRSFELGYTGTGPNRVLHTVEDPNGHTTTVDYEATDAPGPLLTSRSIGRRVTWSKDRRQARKDYAFAARTGGAQGTSFTVTDPPLENQTTRRTRSALLDANARPEELVDGRGTKTQLVWDEAPSLPDNNVTALTEAAGTSDAATSRMEYNEHGQLTKQTDALNRVSTLAYFPATAGAHIAPSGNDTGHTFVSDLQQLTPPKGNWTKFTVDGAGNVTSRQVKDQPAATTTYGARGIIVSEKDEVDNVTQYQEHDPNGLPRRTIDPRTNHWTYEYDSVGNVLKATDPRGSGTAAQNDFAVRLTYDPFDRVTQAITPKRSQQSEFVTRTSDYDENGNLIEQIDGNGKSTKFGYTVMDEQSRQESAPAPHFGESGEAREVATSEYDTLGRLKRRIAPNGEGGVEGDFETTFEYSAADELLVERRKARANDQHTPKELVTSMAYDRRGNVVGVADAKRNANGNPVAVAASPTARRWTYVYDLADNRKEAIEDPGGLALKTTFTYDANDNVESHTSPRGNASGATASNFTTTFGRDTNDLITSIQHKERLTTFERRGDGRITARVEPRGNETADTTADFKTTYEYYATGELLKWTLPRHRNQYGPSGRGVTYDRNAVGDPLTITDPRNGVTTNTFYDTGELATTDRPSLWTRGGDSERDAELDPLAAEGTNDDEIRLRDYSEWLHDQPGGDLPSSEGQGDFGAVESAGMPDLLPRAGATSFAYDNEMRLTSVTDAAGKKTQLERDAVGRVVRELRPFESGRADIKTEYAFDRNGNVRGLVDGEGNRTRRQYDEYDRAILEDAPGASETAPGVGGGGTVRGARTLTRYDANGNVTAIVTPRGSTETKAYDVIDRLESVTAPDTAVARFAYDENGNVTSERRPRGEGKADPQRWSTAFEYTDFDEVKKETQVAWREGAPEEQLVTDYQYDRNGNEIRVEAPGAGLSPSDPNSAAVRRVTTREFDGRDLPWTETVASNDGARTTTTEFDPNGNLRRTINPIGVGADAPTADSATQEGAPPGDAARNATVREFSADNLLTTEWLPRSGSNDPAWRRTFGYDGRGRADKIVAPYHDDASRTTQSVYTRFDTGWIKTASDQAHTTGDGYGQRSLSTYDYDRRGHQTLWQSGTGRRVNRAYYPNGLLRERTARHSDTDNNPRNYTYAYNANRTLTQYLDWDLSRSTVLRQDAAERTTLVNEDWGGGRDTRMEYDEAGNVLQRWTDGEYSEDASGNPQFAGGKRTEFAYDSVDREFSMTVVPTGQPNRVTTTDWWPSGEMKSRTKPNDTVESWAYFETGAIKTMRRKPKGGGDIDQEYTYDRNLNRLTDERGTHEYNARDQLTKWTANAQHGGTTTSYEVSATGAITKETTGNVVTTKTYEGDQLKTERRSVNGGAAQFEADFEYEPGTGNLTKEIRDNPETTDTSDRITTNYVYDPFNRLVGANYEPTTAGEGHVFAFDALDRRDWQCVKGATNQECSGGTKREMGYVGTSNSLSSEVLPLQEGEQTPKTGTYDYTSAMESVGQHDGVQFNVYATDANGSVVGLEDKDGKIKANDEPGGGRQYRYNPYGELLGDRIGSQTNLDTVANRNPFRFEGFYYDAGLRSYDMHARQYMPRIGRFGSEDRFESAMGDFNLQSDHLTQDRYAFAGGNPINNIEWDGHGPDCHAPTPARVCSERNARAAVLRALAEARADAEDAEVHLWSKMARWIATVEAVRNAGTIFSRPGWRYAIQAFKRNDRGANLEGARLLTATKNREVRDAILDNYRGGKGIKKKGSRENTADALRREMRDPNLARVQDAEHYDKVVSELKRFHRLLKRRDLKLRSRP
jgi:RHS repeat-associated protein